MRNLQVIISIVLGGFIVLAILVFSGALPSPKNTSSSNMTGKLIMWGTDYYVPMNAYIDKIFNKQGVTVKYEQKSSENFDQVLIEALASGNGPDLIVLPQDLIVRLESKIALFTPEIYSERDFKDTYIENGEIFITPKGILALPIMTDPMVMYWNRDIFTNKNITLPPVYWDEFLTLAPVLTEKDEANEILKSAISFGEFENVDNAKDILATLILQTGNSLIKRDTSKNSFGPSFLGVRGTDIPSSSEVLRFYTDFVDPVKKIYSWNRSLPPSKQAFLAGNLAVYFGHASELSDIRTKNPNLNFDVALIPQIRNLPRKTTFGDIKGLAIMNISKQKAAAYFAARMMTTPENTEKIAGIFNVESPARLILSKSPANPDAKVFYQSAIISRSWLDPNPNKSSEIFRMSISSINSGQDTSANIAGTMQERFTLLLQKN